MAEKPEDLSLPASVVTRIVKDALPDGVNISKEARTAIGKSASVFILYATACANNFALKAKRKTLTATDVFSALEDMEFEQFVPELREFLEAYKQEQKGKKEAAADRKKKLQAATATLSSPPSDTTTPVGSQPPSVTDSLRASIDINTEQQMDISSNLGRRVSSDSNSGAMSVPAWKQAILDRKKKQEDEQKKKEAEEAAYLSSLPPWKRAMVMKRQSTSPTSTLERNDSSNKLMTSSAPTTPSNKWMDAVQNVRQASPISTRPAWARNEVKSSGESSPKTTNRPAWARNEVKRSGESSPKAANRPAWARNEVKRSGESSPKTTNRPAWARNEVKSSTGSSFNSIMQKTPSSTSQNIKPVPVSSSSTPSKPVARMGRKESVTVLPDYTSSVKPLTNPQNIPAVSLRSSVSKNKPTVHVSDKRRSFEGDDDDDAKLAAMPAWKKALIMRRRASAAQETGKSKPQQSKPSSVSNHIIEDVQKETPTDNHSGTENVINQARTESTSYDETDSPSLLVDVQMSQEDSHPDEHTHMSPAPVEPSKRIRKSRAEKKEVLAKNVPKKEDKQKGKNTPSSSSAPSAKKTSTKVGTKKTSPRVTNTPTSTQGKTKPEIVNRQQGDSDGPSKLVEQEGVVHRPPIYKEVDEWATVNENDPAFTKLPLWKQALIKRRRNDIAKRSGSFVSESSSQAPPQQRQHSSTPGHANTTTENKNQSQNLPSWKAELLKRRGSNTSITVEEKKIMNRAESNRSGSSSQPAASNNMKNLVVRFNSNTTSKNNSTYGKLQPVSQAPVRPAPVRSAPPPPTKNKEEEEEPMFTYSFKKTHKTLDAGSESSDSSDSELEDITLTKIDDTSSDEDDSGIGGIVVTSYKVMNNDFSPPQSPTEVTLPVNGELVRERRESKSILIDTSTKSHRGLRRVSFSDSQLTIEHFYPKYTYHDYDDINSDEDNVSNPGITHSTTVNSGLSHKLHPSLRSTNENDSDVYRYSPSKASPMKPSSHSSLGAYTPSILSGYNGMLQNHISGSGYNSTSPVKSPVKAPEEPDYSSPGIDDRAADFYSHLNTDTAALLW